MITGAEQLAVLYGSKFKFDLEARDKELHEIIDTIKLDYENGKQGVASLPNESSLQAVPLSV